MLQLLKSYTGRLVIKQLFSEPCFCHSERSEESRDSSSLCSSEWHPSV